jgi:uncharacterized protein (DUF1697 family)
MNAYVAFMRAINVAGHGVVKMDALCGAFSAAGCRNVRSYIQSGNVMFESSASEQTIQRNLRTKLRDLLGQEPVVFLRTINELSGLVERDPFQPYRNENKVKFYAVFLAEEPQKKPQFPLLLPKEEIEAFALSGREVFAVCRPNSQGSYGFPNNFIEKTFGTSATTRNWNTVAKIVKFAQNK